MCDAHTTGTQLSCLSAPQLPSSSACAFLLTVLQLLSTRLSLLPSAATCASYNFSFLSPQGLNFSSSQSSAPFWSGTLFFFSFRLHWNECQHFIPHLYFLFTMTRLSCFYRLSFAAHDTSASPPRRALQRRKGHIVPFSPVFTPRVVSTAVARYNFAARDMRELSLREGDMVRIYSKIGGDQGWWKGEANGRVSVS